MNPGNIGEIDNANSIGKVGNPACGVIMQMFIKVEDDVIVDVKFKIGRGNGSPVD